MHLLRALRASPCHVNAKKLTLDPHSLLPHPSTLFPPLPTTKSNIETMASATSDMDEFLRLMQTLPQELHDMIRDLTFSPPIASKAIVVDASYTFPSILQVDHASRQKNATAYFASNAFAIGTEDMLISWLRAVDPEYRRSITEIRFLPFSLQAAPGAALVAKSFLAAAIVRNARKEPPLRGVSHKIHEEQRTIAGPKWVPWAGAK